MSINLSPFDLTMSCVLKYQGDPLTSDPINQII